MKRINEKVKDIVEVRKFVSLQDFTQDPSATLAAYHFTDATAELMVKWLDRIVELQEKKGNAMALAGYRGVGKSHFLATLSAIVSQPELRTKITDSHVASAAQALLRRRYPCIFIRRGTRPTILEELRDGVAAAFGLDAGSLPERVFDILSLVKARSGDIPFLVLADTAIERGARVTRDDGDLLAEIAEAVKAMNAFIGVALDDDIAGADGSNAAIVRSFNIDYLDQEHLYKVVDSYVFPKNQQLRPILHDVYEYFRAVMPTFRWSEQRFTSLYPLHPVILDVAPFVRLYVHDFALLGFAAEAGERILGRPANSLIALDEVFDSAEAELRKVEDLHEAFSAYDRLNSDVVAKIPVMQRLQAKLILKALLILSLEGQGTTVGEISSGTLIFDESDPKKANKTVEEIIRMFAAAVPEDVRVYADEGREVRYGLRVSGKDNFNKLLEETAAAVEDKSVEEVIQRVFHDRFHDSTFVNPDNTKKFSMECHLHWRGGLRRGRVLWRDMRPESTADAQPGLTDPHDWEVVIDRTKEEAEAVTAGDLPRAIWKAAELTADEIAAVKRYHVLLFDQDFRASNSENIRGALHSHAILLERIIGRLFLEDGRLVIDGFDYNFTEEARASVSLGDLLSTMLEPLFETRYPEHPYFLRNLGLGEVSSLVSDLYSGSRQKLSDVQQLAQTFALPLGLVKLIDGVYYPASQEQLLTKDSVKTVEALLDRAGKETVELKKVYNELRKPPYGLVREAQQLLLTAMVAQRMIEFVTSKGDRINQRSLDLKIIWDDIIGLARPQESSYSSKKLGKWVSLITGDKNVGSVVSEAEISLARDAFARWLAQWDETRILARFNDIPEERLNTRIWRSVGNASKTLGAAAAAVRKFLGNTMTLEECLGRISESFVDNTANLESAMIDLETVRIFLEGYAKRETIRNYAILAGTTGVAEIEQTRERLLAAMANFDREPSEENERPIGHLWAKFQRGYSEHFAAAHDSVMHSHQLQAELDDIRKGGDWWLLENLRDLVGGSSAADDIDRDVSELNCTAKTLELLQHRPVCSCRYDIARHRYWETVVSRFNEKVVSTNQLLLKELRNNSTIVQRSLSIEFNSTGDTTLSKAAEEVRNYLNGGAAPEEWSHPHVQILRSIASPGGDDRGDPVEARRVSPEHLPSSAEIEDALLSVN